MAWAKRKLPPLAIREQNQTRVNWAKPALTVRGLGFILLLSLISFLLLSADENRVIYISHSCAPLRYTIRNIKSNRKNHLKAHGRLLILTSPRVCIIFFLLKHQVTMLLPQIFAGLSVGCQKEAWATLTLWDTSNMPGCLFCSCFYCRNK